MPKSKGAKMKYLLTLLLIASVSVSAESDRQNICEAYSKLAKGVMTLRQIGEGMASVYSGSDTAHYKKLVIDAYEQPMYSSKAYKDKAIAKFQNKAFLQCIKSQ